MGTHAKRLLAIVPTFICCWLAAGTPGHRSAWINASAQEPCGDNPIVCENRETGDPDYDVTDGGDPTIQGYAASISVNVGQTVDFKIQTDAASYDIAIYRLGYYGGAGARKVATLGSFEGEPQPDCDYDTPTGLVDCGKWHVSASWDTSGVVSGVFVAKLTRADGSRGSNHIVFIVRDDARTADIVVQTSDTTWQAYNQFPGFDERGASLYCGGPISNEGTAYQRACATRAAKVSYNRPFDTRRHDPQSWLFNAEYPMLRWLEANGYDVKYWTGVDTEQHGSELTGPHAPKVFLSVGHDEYWSAGQRLHVENARDAGVSLGFFSGNEMYWKTRWEPSIDGAGTPYRTLVSYKETMRNALNGDPRDPLNSGTSPISTGTWRDAQFGAPADGGRPENALTGTIWTVNCCSSQIKVPAEMGAMRFWWNTRIADLPPGGVAELTPESLGYEWDEDLDNGSRPAGLVHLSSTTEVVAEKLLDAGSTVGEAPATHHLTLYRHPKGALVFGAGTVQWSWGLDATHDRGAPDAHVPDQAMQQATINILADMGAVPANRQPGADPGRPLLVPAASTDVLAPMSSIVNPAAAATVHQGARVTITGTSVDQGGGTVASVDVSTDDGATWRRAQGTNQWTFQWTPSVLGPNTIRVRATDDGARVEAAGPGVTVTVDAGNCPCTSLWRPSDVPAVLDEPDPAALELGVKFRSDIAGFITGIRYYKGPGNSSTHVGSLWSASDRQRLAEATFEGESASGWQEALFDAPVAIQANTVYVASYHTNVGHYSHTVDYFATDGIDSAPLHALASGAVGGNGVFARGVSAYPDQTSRDTNYWVDVVFTPTITDHTAPVITGIRATTIDSSNVVIAWQTSEAATSRIEYSLDAGFPAAATTTVPNTVFLLTHTLAIGGLAPNHTYYYRITATDRSGNPATSEARTFAVPGPTLRDTAQGDFAAGQTAAVYVAQTGDGEVILPPAAGSEFSGIALSPGWIAVPWDTGGLVEVGDGALFVDGARVGTCTNDPAGNCTIEETTFTPGHSLEFVAHFSGDAFQHAGFGVTLGSTSEPWAIFSTLDGGRLFARTNTGTQVQETVLGNQYLLAPHRYRIDWKLDGTVAYAVDGVEVASHTLAINHPMRPIAASDFNVFGGSAVIDWIRMTPYAASGTFLSRVFDAGSPVSWQSIQWSATTPPGTAVAISLRSGNTASPEGGGWTDFIPVTAPGALDLASQFVQYRAELSTSDPAVTPSLDDIIVSTGHAPIAVDDEATVAENGSRLFPASGSDSLTLNDSDADANTTLRVVAITAPAHGTATLDADGAVVYTPAASYSGPDAFFYTVSDGVLTASAQVRLAIRFGNTAPVANPDVLTLDEDTHAVVPAAAGVLANDTDVEHNTLSAVLVTPPAHGTLSLGANGSYSYTPEPNYAGPDAFRYKVTDGIDDGSEALVQITILPINDAPIARDDAFAATTAQPLTVAAAGLLGNDRDVEVEDILPLHVVAVSQPAHGALALDADGGFTYTPTGDFLGADSFTYSAVDHFGAVSAPATVTITVNLTSLTLQSPAGGTVTTGTALSAEDPLLTSVTTPSAATVTIAHGVISGADLRGEFTLLNRQVNVTVLTPDGLEYAGTPATPLTLAFTIDGSLIPADRNAATVEMFRNGAEILDCPGATVIPSIELDPCITDRQAGAGNSVTLTVLTSHASRWNLGLESGELAPIARDDASYTADFAASLAVPAPGVLGNDYARKAVTAALAGPAHGGTVELAPSGAFTFTPEAGFCGTATFNYVANDGTLNSNEGTANITVDCQPVAAADAFTVAEDSGVSTLTVLPNDFDPDAGQVLSIASVTQGANGTVAIAGNGTWLNYTPAADFFGTDTFTYTIADGRGGTATGTVTVNVSAVDDIPSFIGGADQNAFEDVGLKTVPAWATAISAGPANESAQGLSFLVSNTNNALFSVQPAVAADGTLTYTPAPNANGVATVTVTLHDDGGVADGGIDASAAYTFLITVTAVNDAPSYTIGADQRVGEDAGPQTVTAWATAISAGPADEAGQAVTFSVTDNTNTALFAAAPSIAANGTLTYTPAANANGSAVITVALHDDGGTANHGGDAADLRTFTITVASTNDAPSFVKGADQTVLEDSGAHSVAWATAISAGPSDESGQALNFLVTNTNNALFSVQPSIAGDGTLSYAAAANANGSATVTVALQDNGGAGDGGVDLSAAATFVITVTAVNDAPSYTKGADQQVAEDAGPQTVTGWATAISAGPTDEAAQTVTFSVTDNTNAALFAAAPSIAANGTLTYTPAANANGSAVITVGLRDDGGVANHGSDAAALRTFTITVASTNDAPSFVKGADQTVLEDSGARALAWATAISAGPANESAQTVSFLVTNTNNALFSVQPSIAADGTLSYTPAANANGAATVKVMLQDDGGVAYGGVDRSAEQTFIINVTAVNDAPSYTRGADQRVGEDAGPQTVTAWATAIAAGPTDEANQALTFSVTGNTNAALFAVAPSIAANGTLTYTPAVNANGSAMITVALGDNGGTANHGVDTAASQTFAITVASANDAPTFVKGADQTVFEDSGTHSLAWATAISAGPSDETGQTLRFVVTNSNNALFSVQPSIAADGTLTYAAAANANGAATVTVALQDNGGVADGGVDRSAEQTFVINVTAINDVPSYTKGADQQVAEDAGLQTVTAWATAISAGPTDEAAQALTFAVTANTNAALFAVAPSIAANGTLTYTPAANANGSAVITVALRDDGGTADGGADAAAAQTFSITVASANDAPTFVKGADQTVTEDSGPHSVAWATAISAGPSDEAGQALNFLVTNSNSALFSVQPAIAADGTLTYTPAANVSGNATVTVRLHDNGGTTGGGAETSAAQSFVVAVAPVNDVPSFAAGSSLSVQAGAGAQTIPNWATAISAGPGDEASQAVNFIVATDNPALFAAAPVVAPNGTLTFTPAASGGGVANVTVQVHDNGGTANGGSDTSAAQAFTIALPFPTSTSVTASLASTAYGQEVTLTANVTSAGGAPAGTVEFFDAPAAGGAPVSLGTATIAAGGAVLKTNGISAGSRSISAVYQGAAMFRGSTSAAVAHSVSVATTTTTLTTTAGVQYSDITTFTTTVSSANVGPAPPAASASFKVGTQIVGSAPFVLVGTKWQATWTGPLVETAPVGQLRPGAKTISVVYNSVSPNYTLANRSGSTTIKTEDARVSYMGPTAVNTGCATCATTTVKLQAMVADIAATADAAGDIAAGDIRNATVTFVNRATGVAIGAAKLTLSDPADSRTAIASFDWTVNLGTATSQSFSVGIVVGNYYTRNSTLDNVTVVVKKQ